MSTTQTGPTGQWLVAQQHAAKQAERTHAAMPKDWPRGWYRDPKRSDRMRWWDGGQWTANTAPRQ